MRLFKLSTVCLNSATPELSPLKSVCSTSVLVFFFPAGLYCVNFVVVPHIDSRTWMIYGRLSIHKMFGTNHVVFAWLPVFPCFRVLSIGRFNPLLSLFRVTFQCWKRITLEKDNVGKSGHIQSWFTQWQLCEVQNPSSIFAADMYCYCSEPQHKSSFSFVKSLCPRFSFSKHGDRRKTLSKQRETSTIYIDSFPVARNFVIDHWTSEL